MRISIIIPTLNEEQFIASSINSALKQTSQLVEIIVVDAGSKDKTRQEVEQFESIKFISNPALKGKKYDLIHAHYGLSGLLATLQKITPVIVTFHGSDVNMKKNLPFSLLASRLSYDNIFVHHYLPKKLKVSGKNIHIIPCGVNLDIFSPMNKIIARDKPVSYTHLTLPTNSRV